MNSTVSIFLFVIICLGVAMFFKWILIKVTNGYKNANYSIHQVGEYYIIVVKENGKIVPADQFLRAYKKEMDQSQYKTLEKNYASYELAEIALMRFKIAIGQITTINTK